MEALLKPQELKEIFEELTMLTKPWIRIENRPEETILWIDHKKVIIGSVGHEWFISLRKGNNE